MNLLNIAVIGAAVLERYPHNHQRPHRRLGVVTPEGRHQPAPIASAAIADVRRRNLLGGLQHEYYQAAA